jgi:hypothetical protein
LAYIEKQHNRTKEAPPGRGGAVFVAEFGLAQNHVANVTLSATVENVVNEALKFGSPYVLFWETYDNECTDLSLAGCGSGTAGTSTAVPAAGGRLHEERQLYDNYSRRYFEGGSAASAINGGNGRCHDAAHPVTDPSKLNGFWLVKPDGSTAWPYKYLKGKIDEGRGYGYG